MFVAKDPEIPRNLQIAIWGSQAEYRKARDAWRAANGYPLLKRK